MAPKTTKPTKSSSQARHEFLKVKQRLTKKEDTLFKLSKLKSLNVITEKKIENKREKTKKQKNVIE